MVRDHATVCEVKDKVVHVPVLKTCGWSNERFLRILNIGLAAINQWAVCVRGYGRLLLEKCWFSAKNHKYACNLKWEWLRRPKHVEKVKNVFYPWTLFVVWYEMLIEFLYWSAVFTFGRLAQGINLDPFLKYGPPDWGLGGGLTNCPCKKCLLRKLNYLSRPRPYMGCSAWEWVSEYFCSISERHNGFHHLYCQPQETWWVGGALKL